MKNYKHTLIGFIAGALLVIGANSFDKVVAVHVIAPIQTLQPMEVGE
jgi:hypothetical protein